MIAASLVLATQVVVWHSYRADEQRGFEACVAEWNRAHADVQVEALALPHDGFSSKLEAAIPRGNGPGYAPRCCVASRVNGGRRTGRELTGSPRLRMRPTGALRRA